MNLEELKTRLKAALLAAQGICKAAEDANRDFTSEEREQVQKHLKEAGDLKDQIKAAEGDADLRRQIADLGAGLELRSETPQGKQSLATPGKGKTLGEMFVESAGYKEWIGKFPNGRIPDSAKGLMSPPVQFKTLLTGGSDTLAGAFVNTDVTGIYEPLGRRPLVLRNLISNRTTTSDTVEYVRQTAKVTQAAPVAEANVTTYAGSEGQVEGAKPEGAMAFEKVTATVKTIAVWVPATKRALSDASQLRSIIDQELRADLEEDVEDEIVAGNGSGEHFDGLEHASGTLEQSWDTDLITTTRKAVTTLQTTGRSNPTAWLVNPVDDERLDLLKDDQGRYYYAGPQQITQKTLWSRPVVPCEAVTEGTGILGDWRKAVLWDREQANISVSDSHADFFIRNMVAILGEERAAFGIIRPSAFVFVPFTSGS